MQNFALVLFVACLALCCGFAFLSIVAALTGAAPLYAACGLGATLAGYAGNSAAKFA
jgi:hypothetical protein